MGGRGAGWGLGAGGGRLEGGCRRPGSGGGLGWGAAGARVGIGGAGAGSLASGQWQLTTERSPTPEKTWGRKSHMRVGTPVSDWGRGGDLVAWEPPHGHDSLVEEISDLADGGILEETSDLASGGEIRWRISDFTGCDLQTPDGVEGGSDGNLQLTIFAGPTSRSLLRLRSPPTGVIFSRRLNRLPPEPNPVICCSGEETTMASGSLPARRSRPTQWKENKKRGADRRRGRQSE
ncbi:hypothetical protein TIFTF001_012098 [Ficus carica]|uniref:Uncharacterized protein n=1 Tax=Ficus carica TaxID=3494 RepID=A0AA88A1R7_FICCA|nr:hypothetical protein TIFTF001_012098 [Ficus carica]